MVGLHLKPVEIAIFRLISYEKFWGVTKKAPPSLNLRMQGFGFIAVATINYLTPLLYHIRSD